MKEHSDSKSKYTKDDIIKMLEFLVDTIFVVFAGKLFQQIVVSLFEDLFESRVALRIKHPYEEYSGHIV